MWVIRRTGMMSFSEYDISSNPGVLTSFLLASGRPAKSDQQGSTPRAVFPGSMLGTAGSMGLSRCPALSHFIGISSPPHWVSGCLDQDQAVCVHLSRPFHSPLTAVDFSSRIGFAMASTAEPAMWDPPTPTHPPPASSAVVRVSPISQFLRTQNSLHR